MEGTVRNPRLALILEISASGNVSAACKRLNISRSHYYYLLRQLRTHGPEGVEIKRRRIPRMPNAFPEAVVSAVLCTTARFPTYSSRRVAQELLRRGLKVSSSGVRKIWVRWGMSNRISRFLWLDRQVAAGRATVSDRVKRTIEQIKSDLGAPSGVFSRE